MNYLLTFGALRGTLGALVTVVTFFDNCDKTSCFVTNFTDVTDVTRSPEVP